LRQFREQPRHNRSRDATCRASKQYNGRLDFLTKRENCPEVCVGRYHDALLPSGTIENILIVGSLQSVLTYVDCVVTSIPEKRRHQR